MPISKKEEYLAVLAHQLKQPVSNIKNYLSAIIDGDFGRAPPGIKKQLRFISKYSQEFSNFIDDIIALSKIQSGTESLKKELNSLTLLVKTVIFELKKEAQKKKIRIELKIKNKIPPFKFNHSMIKAVVTNLIDNAIKYSQKVVIKVSLKGDKNSVIITVQDQGIGLNTKELKSIFKKFKRGPKTNLLHRHGLGLGLYLAEIVIKVHSGKIWAESKGLRQGSTFFIKLPIKN